MPATKSRPSREKGVGTKARSRQDRNARRPRNDTPFLRLVEGIQADERIRRPVKPKTTMAKPLNAAQVRYDVAIASATVIFGIGPAGTGKTWFAGSRAAEALRDGLTKSIIVTRPTIEAGQSLGFLPGELEEKNEPYFRPVREALTETLGSGALEYHLKDGSIEARPLAYMRGATFKDCWIILDEAQNTTAKEMELFLTRIGENAKVIINGDPRQLDLPAGVKSGLLDAVERLRDDVEVDVVTFTSDDIVRSGFCQRVVRAYEKSL